MTYDMVIASLSRRLCGKGDQLSFQAILPFRDCIALIEDEARRRVVEQYYSQPTHYGEMNSLVRDAIRREPGPFEDELVLGEIDSRYVAVQLSVVLTDPANGLMRVPLMLRPEIVDKIVRVRTTALVLRLPPEAKRSCGIYVEDGVVGQVIWVHDDPGKGHYLFTAISTGEPSRSHADRVLALYLDIMMGTVEPKIVWPSR
ncbi:MAG: hypothetical protein UY72_C0074G0003 [Candidatus Uhrbacteria bacterium GW2011_GWD2_52_7]|uniref:Uncharacterized protein n=1 Tax=Candidatus Uhrbacteria bacterium GW2011_GWD2_52_7 TaxID=1618989 RepID=A0A0G1XBM1_9BACT|nr:MAG: hypothetical protein UY72_C0074G0003 [Candidatus Uhrbacteria bacterium GW2011_GWD2_52_7]